MNVKNLSTQPACTDDDGEMLPFDKAIRLVLNSINSVCGYQYLPIRSAVGRVVGDPIISTINVPRFTNSAVDGYAIQSQDIPSRDQIANLPILGKALAGLPYTEKLEAKQCIRITTGAIVPNGADTVIMQEHAERHTKYISIDHRHKAGQNVRMAGEDIIKGNAIIGSGKSLTPADIGLLASVGVSEIKLKRLPRIAMLSTGDEIQDVGTELIDGIFDSNRYTLASALKLLGIEVIDLGIIPDNKVSLHQTLSSFSNKVDIIIASGGVSVGDADYVKEVLDRLGRVEFWKVAIKPGRPFAFGKINNAYFFGLPGNPVAVMVTFYQFVVPALRKLMGIKDHFLAPTFKAKTVERLRKKPGRTEFQRGVLEQHENGEWIVKTTGKQGSGILTSMSLANAFIVLPHDSDTVEPGEMVTVQPFSALIP